MDNITNEDLCALHQALYVAECYYEDTNRVAPKGMATADEELAAERLKEIRAVTPKVVAAMVARLGKRETR